MRGLAVTVIGTRSAISCVSCANRAVEPVGDSPLIVVIKLNSAEAFNDRQEATKYINVQSVYDPRKYSAQSSKDTPSAGEIYDQHLKFKSSLGKDKKFSSEFPYFKFHITETVKGSAAEVIFVPHDDEEQLLRYQLTRVNGRWIVPDIKGLRQDDPGGRHDAPSLPGDLP